jgi:hypothetical protein
VWSTYFTVKCAKINTDDRHGEYREWDRIVKEKKEVVGQGYRYARAPTLAALVIIIFSSSE